MVYLVNLGNNVLAEGLMQIIREDNAEVVLLSNHGTAPSYNPDVVIFDSFQDVCELKGKYPEAKFLFMDPGIPDMEIACLLLCHQVNGIIAPDTNLLKFGKALRVVLDGEVWVDQANLKAMQCNGLSLPKGGGLKGLSNQDMRIVALVVQGQKNKDIATGMCLSESTVKSHISRIYKKLNVKNRAQLATLSSGEMMPLPLSPPL